jgi:hypothetical protein
MNIARTKFKACGGITARKRKLLAKHAQRWINVALRTAPIEPDKIVPAIEGLYRVAGLPRPRVVIVPSPLVMAFAYGAAAAIWYARGNAITLPATHNRVFVATRAAARAATHAATCMAAGNATREAVDAATREAVDAAAREALDAATREAVDAATEYAITHMAAIVNAATHIAAFDAAFAATHDAADHVIRAAVDAATYQETREAIYAATHGTIYEATQDTTEAATITATHEAVDVATESAVAGAIRACVDLAGELGLACAKQWTRNYQGGAMFAPYDCYITAFRDVLGLELPEYAHYQYWEQAALHGGFRVLHKEFCLVSDFPECIKVDAQGRPHCADGPSHRWRDGWSLYHWHGVRVPAHWILHRDRLDPVEVLQVENVEQRAAGASIIGMRRMLDRLPHRILDSHPDPQCGDLIEVHLPGLPEPELYLRFVCPRNGPMLEAVNKRELGRIDLRSAHAWHAGVPARLYSYPKQRS